jgi:hypothetical protein
MMNPVDAFSNSYAQARTLFLGAAAQAGLKVISHAHPERGRDGEDLSMDVVLDGAPDAKNLLIVSSACHGVEGYCGSGVQVFSLQDDVLRERLRASGCAVLYIHALNPYGFSHVRRTTHENVDLNRNFQDFSKPLSVNSDYAALHDLLLPEQWPPDEQNNLAIASYVENHGINAFQSAVTRGQQSFPDGLFFGGTEPTWSNRTLRQVLRDHAGGAQRIAWIDLHTGLGPSGVGERIFACKDDAQAYARAKLWWGGEGATPLTSIYDGSSTSAFLTGLMWMALYQECPKAEYTGIAMEYGTLPIEQMIQALRAEHWLNKHPEASPELATSIKQQMLDAFYVNADEWKYQIISQAQESIVQAVNGLSS